MNSRAAHSEHTTAGAEGRIDGVGVERCFLDWTAPLLPQAARWLIHHAEQPAPDGLPRCIDLRGALCVLPGRRAGRLLLDELLRAADQAGRNLLPPTITTPGPAVDRLLEPAADAPFAVADHATAELAWMAALRDCPHECLSRIVAARPPDEDWPQWYDLAATVSRVHDTVAGARQQFETVAELAERRELIQEGDRWGAMQALHNLYRDVLKERGWIDAHDQREAGLSRLTRVDSLTRIVLIGVVDLNVLQRAALTRAAELTETTALVHAPQQWADRFDGLGCVAPDHWRDVVIDHDSFTLLDCDRPADQAQQVVRTLARFGGKYAADEITIGLGDESLAGPIERAARWAGVSMHHATGRPLARSGPYRLLSVVAEWLTEQRFAHFAALVRHPHLEHWLRRQRGEAAGTDQAVQHWSTLLDAYFSDHLQQRLDGRWLGSHERQRQLKAVFQQVSALLQPLTGKPRRLGQWSPSIVDVLRSIYQPEPPERATQRMTPATARACEELRNAAVDLECGDAALQPVVSAATALRLLLKRCGQQPLAENPRDEQVEMLGWLELHADPAPALIVAGVNEGAIPSSVTADLFLPDSLRRQLGMPNNETRYARDAYYLSALPKSREQVTLLAGRRSTGDDPLTPSRLLLTGDDDTLLQRAAELCNERATTSAAPPVGLGPHADETRFDVPGLPESVPVPESMRVTDFTLYLRCPFRYALARLLNLQRYQDDAPELDPLHFGSLIHRALQQLGHDPALRRSSDEARIERELCGMLDELARDAYGSAPMPSIRLQLAAAKRRLSGFAAEQAALRNAGWELVCAEHELTEETTLEVPGGAPMPLRGRIDRIDRHCQSNAWRVIDYKTGERGDCPVSTHHGRTKIPAVDECQWCDLQLPLYDYILRQSGVVDRDSTVELGYIVLPKDSSKVAFRGADWSTEHLEHAVRTAQDIVSRIRSGHFERSRDVDSRYDEFARLCHTEFFATFADDDQEAVE